jgi:hypothetical protein
MVRIYMAAGRNSYMLEQQDTDAEEVERALDALEAMQDASIISISGGVDPLRYFSIQHTAYQRPESGFGLHMAAYLAS